MMTSGQSNLTKRPHHRRLWTVQWYLPGCTSVHPRASLGHTNGISIGSANFAQLVAVSSGMPGHVFSPKNCPLAWGDLDLCLGLIHGSLGPPESTSQTASRSVQTLLQDRPTRMVQSYLPGGANVHPYVTHFLGPN